MLRVIQQPLTLTTARPRSPTTIRTLNIGAKAVQPTLTLRTGLAVQPTGGQAGPTAAAYKQYDHRTHVYMKADTYIGVDERMIREEWLYDIANRKMVNVSIDFVPGCERLFLEILTNASDNVGRSRRAGVDPGGIEILMDNSTISVTNYGLPIPIEIHPKEGVYVPQMIFGSLLTSSNYEVERHEAGTNGIGAKATNIFSKEFMVIVNDHIRHLKYTQIWNENMTRRNEPVIEPFTGTRSSTQVVYKMDFARFRYPVPLGPQGGYPPEAFVLFARHAVDISFTAKTMVTFNGQEFNYANIREYARLYFGDAVDTAIVHYQWPPGTEIIHKKKGYEVAKNPAIVPEIELIAIDTPDEGHHVSFINCMMTRDGGIHVNSAIKAVGDSAVQMVNETIVKKLVKQNKGKELDAKEKRAHTITINDVKPHISILLSARALDPKFTSQTKTMLGAVVKDGKTQTKIDINISEEELRGINRWQLIDRLYAALDAKQFASLAKTDGKLKRFVRLQKGVDANNAGKADRHRCVLYITEGRSGAGYANTLVSLVPGGRDHIGVLPMRGKSLNVMNADRFKIEKNEEIKELKKMLGLVDCPDPKQKATYYLDPNNFSRLRYGAIMIMADSDVDGKHIIGLILNFFHCRFPSLLARGFVLHYRTPTLRVTHGRTVLKFYLQSEYDAWKAQTPNYQSWHHKYYKGLGTSDDDEVADDYGTPRVVTCLYDEDAPEAMRLAFDKDRADQRKDWIGRWRPVMDMDLRMQPISQFVNEELILFGIAAVQRAIPKLTDGLKQSHRKIIYGAHKKWKIGSKKTGYSEVKVAQFAPSVAGQTHYSHGEQVLDEVVIGMAQNFTGSNNIPWFFRKGQFGKRYFGGKDASSSRYLHTYPERLMAKILRKEDRPILIPVIEEGDEVEPETYWPIIPMALVNGVHGVGMAWSSTIPSHNALDLKKWLAMKLQGAQDDDLPDIIPWYNGFNGTIRVIDRRRRQKRLATKVEVITVTNEDGTQTPQVTRTQVEEDDDDNDSPVKEGLNEEEEDRLAEEFGSRPLLSMISLGKFHIDMSGTIIVTELPLGRWPLSYRKWLEELEEEKKITGYRDLCGDNVVYFEIQGFKEPPSYRTLKLRRTMGMSNMVLLDEGGQPVRYDTAFDILEAFYARRLPVYQRRKDYILQHLAEEIVTMRHKIAFIQAVINGQIHIINRKIAAIRVEMDQLGIPHEIYEGSKTRHLSEDDIAAFMDQIAAKEQERVVIEQTTPAQMWLRDLDEFEEEYRTVFGLRKQGITLTIGQPVAPKNPFPDTKPATTLTMDMRNIVQQARRPARVITPKSQEGSPTDVKPPLRLVMTPIPAAALDKPPDVPPKLTLNLNIAPIVVQ